MEVSRVPNSIGARAHDELTPIYDQTIVDEMDLRLLSSLTRVEWSTVKKAADLACGTGRTGLWLKSQSIEQIDGLDITPTMLEIAAGRGVYSRLVYGDMRTTMLGSGSYDLVTSVLADEYIPDLKPLYNEVSRILRTDGYYIDLGFHQYFLLNGNANNFESTTDEMKSYVHLMSDHFRAAIASGFELVEMNERVVDDAWVAQHPTWAKHLNQPISYIFVWQKRQTVVAITNA